ncbi:MAG: hypothetical protein RI993_2115 [Pseudomonadota bacterium]|jgi:hypothetical protein
MNVFSGERLLNKLSGFCEALHLVLVTKTNKQGHVA